MTAPETLSSCLDGRGGACPRVRALVVSGCVLLGLGACSGKALVRGRVVDAGGPLEGVTVRGRAGQTETDAEGLFSLPVRRQGDLLVFEHAGHAPALRPVTAGEAEWVTVLLEMAREERSTVEDSSRDATVFVGAFREVTVHLPAGAVAGTGPVEVGVAYVPVLSGLQPPPVPFQALFDGEARPIEVFSMVSLDLRCGGAPCALGTEPIVVRLPSGGAPAAPTLFSLDPEAGLWVPGPRVESDGAYDRLSLTSTGWFAVGAPLDPPAGGGACVAASVQTPTGRALPGASVRLAFGPSARRTLGGQAGAAGDHCATGVPGGEAVQVAATHFLRPEATAPVSATLTLTPSASGAACGTEGCETVALTLACTEDRQCGPGFRCTAGECVEERGPGTLKVSLRNEGSEAVHLWGPGEGMDEGTRVEAGAHRRLKLQAAPGETPLFHAGRDGQTLADLACLVVTIPNRAAAVIWDGEVLRCEGF